MKERLKILRKNLNLTQTEFADSIGVKQSTIATYEAGRNIPSDPVITLICQRFSVNEDWLRTGEGEPFVELSRDAQITRFVGEAMAGTAPTDQQRFLNALLGSTPEELHAIAQFAKRLAAEYEKDQGI